jgi:DtxR family Mn-dependent transcriptional regulator
MKDISKEDYLKAIYHLQKDKNRAIKSVELAKDLNISKASVNEMIKKLAGLDLIEYKLYSSINLTKKGIKEAEKIIYKHRILENFLSKILRIKKSKIHSEADKLEHGVSTEATEKLKKLLKNPKTCPHGDKIPNINKEACLLTTIKKNTGATILFTKIKNKQVLERINSIGLVPETKIKVLNKIKRGPIELQVKGTKLALSQDICSNIYVKESK